MRPVATGTSTITATVGAVSGSATLTVLLPPVTQQGEAPVNGTSGYDVLIYQGVEENLPASTRHFAIGFRKVGFCGRISKYI